MNIISFCNEHFIDCFILSWEQFRRNSPRPPSVNFDSTICFDQLDTRRHVKYGNARIIELRIPGVFNSGKEPLKCISYCSMNKDGHIETTVGTRSFSLDLRMATTTRNNITKHNNIT